MAKPEQPPREVQQQAPTSNEPDDEVVRTPTEARQGRKGIRILVVLCASLALAVIGGFAVGWGVP